MKNKLLATTAFLLFVSALNCQITMPTPGGNKKASITEWIGITKVTVDYDRPAVKGREGKIWGGLVHYGFADLNYGTSKAAPWRAGANENTTIEFSTEVFIEDKLLPAGKYGFFIAMGEENATLVFSKFNTAWGSFYYNAKDDALRVEAPVVKTEKSIERLKFEFDNQTETAAELSLQWEFVKIPFTISVDLQKLQIESFRKEFNSGQFYRYWQNMHTAANYCLVNDVNLEEALSWADRSINTYFGEANFLTLSTYAGLLEKFDRNEEADSIMQVALPMATPMQLFQYGRNLVNMRTPEKAMEIFEMNLEKNPQDNYAFLGMVMGHYILENKEEALKYARKGKLSTADPGWKEYFDSLIDGLNEGRKLFK